MRIKLFPYLTIDYKAAEAMLNRMAAQGWVLKKLFLGLFAIFTRTERANLRYFVDFGDSLYYEAPDYLALCADAGWVNVGYTRSMNLYASTPGAQPVPLQTDSALEYQRFRKLVLKRTRATGILYGVLALFLLGIVLLLGGKSTFGATLSIGISFSYLFSLIFLSLPPLLVCGGIYLALLLSRIRQWRTLTEAGEPIPVPTPQGAESRGLLTLLGGGYLLLFEFSYALDLIFNFGFSGKSGILFFVITIPLTALVLYIMKTSVPRRRTTPGYAALILGYMMFALILNAFFPTAPLLQPVPELPTTPIFTTGRVYRQTPRGSYLGRMDSWTEFYEISDGAGSVRIRLYTFRFDWMADALEASEEQSSPDTFRIRNGNTLFLTDCPLPLLSETLQSALDAWQKREPGG